LARRHALLRHWPVDISGVGALPTVSAGLHLTIPVESLAREQELVMKAEDAGVELNALSYYWLSDSEAPVDNRAGLVLGFAAVDETATAAALERLRQAWR